MPWASVVEILKAFEWASGLSIQTQILPRRAGDVSASYAKADKAAQVLGWVLKVAGEYVP